MLKIGIPSKGRLQQDSFNWFAKRGISLRRSNQDREYSGTVEGMPEIELVLLSAVEIAKELSRGRIHLGITGTDLIRENLPLWQSQIETIIEMGFGFANLVIAVPKVWVDVNTLHDLDAVASQFRKNHGFRLRIATKYHNLIRQGLRDYGVANYQLVDSQGATEGTISNLTAEAIADITSSGATLEANHLKILKDGIFLKSQASIFRSRTANWEKAMQSYQTLCKKMEWET